MRFLPWSLPRLGHGGGKRQFVTLGFHSDTSGKRVRLTRKTRPGVSLQSVPDPDLGHPNLEEMEKIAPAFLRRSGG